MAMSSTKVSMKLLIEPKSSRVMYAEADKDVVDVMFSFPNLPTTIFTKLVKNNCILKPNTTLLLQSPQSSTPITLYRCPNNHSTYVTDDPRVSCPACNSRMNYRLNYVAPQTKDFVKAATHILMDDLEVKSMTTISICALLNKFNVKVTDVLEEKVVNLSIDELKKMVTTSAESKTVLTDAFLKETRKEAE